MAFSEICPVIAPTCAIRFHILCVSQFTLSTQILPKLLYFLMSLEKKVYYPIFISTGSDKCNRLSV